MYQYEPIYNIGVNNNNNNFTKEQAIKLSYFFYSIIQSQTFI